MLVPQCVCSMSQSTPSGHNTIYYPCRHGHSKWSGPKCQD